MSDTIRKFATISNALYDALDYFKNRADADGDGEGGFIANEEMVLQMTIEAAQEALKALRVLLVTGPTLVNTETENGAILR